MKFPQRERQGKIEKLSEAINSIDGKVSAITESIENSKHDLESFRESIQKEIIDSIRKGNNKNDIVVADNTTAVQDNISQIRDFQKTLLEFRKSIDEEINIQGKELMEKRQEIENLKKEIKRWQDSAIDFFGYIERTLALANEGSDTTNEIYIKITDKFLKDFERRVNNLGLERICPLYGDDFNDEFYEALTQEESTEVPTEKILRCTDWGYKINGECSKRAKVVIAKNSEKGIDDEQSNSKDLSYSATMEDELRTSDIQLLDESDGLKEAEQPENSDGILQKGSTSEAQASGSMQVGEV